MPAICAVGVERDGRVVVEARRAALKERCDDGHAGFARHFGKLGGGWAGNRLGQIEKAQDPRAGKSIGSGRARAGRRSARPAARPRGCGRAPRRSSPRDPRPCASARGRRCICVLWSFLVFRASSRLRAHCNRPYSNKANPDGAESASIVWSDARQRYSSRISTAAAMVVVHLPRLSPTADWVTLLVRTILLEMR